MHGECKSLQIRLLMCSFLSFLDGHFVCCDNLLSVSFCGEERIFKIVSIHPLVEENNGCTSMTSTMETNDERDVDTTIAEKMSGLAIGSKEEVEQKLERESPLQVFKITARSKITVVEDSKEAEEVCEYVFQHQCKYFFLSLKVIAFVDGC